MRRAMNKVMPASRTTTRTPRPPARVPLLSLLLAGGLLVGSPVRAAKIKDVTHLKGQRTNRLLGIGLVIGLKGTGDGGDFAPAIRPLAAMLSNFGNPIIRIDELDGAKNVAIVSVEAVLPENGIREGDRVDVHVSSIGRAKSLLGGRL